MQPQVDRHRPCPICGQPAERDWIPEQRFFFVTCARCTTFTISPGCTTIREAAWQTGDRETLRRLEFASRYLRNAGDDDDRNVTEDSWLQFAVEGEELPDA